MPLRPPRQDWPASVYSVDENFEIVEELAQCANFGIGYVAYKKALQMRSYSIVQLCEKGRIVWTAKTGGMDPETGKVTILWEK
ncbi:hypothetical protein [Chelativorans sp.]|uniref:hypothetical protein n=1 Tax=Chelativorans sp. TaxID=2203393 RepID=UPI0028115776|nr:hypothetical protein [Chelativorans sp.]